MTCALDHDGRFSPMRPSSLIALCLGTAQQHPQRRVLANFTYNVYAQRKYLMVPSCTGLKGTTETSREHCSKRALQHALSSCYSLRDPDPVGPHQHLSQGNCCRCDPRLCCVPDVCTLMAVVPAFQISAFPHLSVYVRAFAQ